MATLADQFHDTFDAYYAGKKSGWCETKAASQDAGWRRKRQVERQEREREDAPAESRH